MITVTGRGASFRSGAGEGTHNRFLSGCKRKIDPYPSPSPKSIISGIPGSGSFQAMGYEDDVVISH
jgi:hypothetical protein